MTIERAELTDSAPLSGAAGNEGVLAPADGDAAHVAAPATPRPAKRLREGRRVSLVPEGGPPDDRLVGTVVDHDAGTLRVRVEAGAAGALADGSRWLVELGRPGDARYRLHGRVLERDAADPTDGSTVRLAVHDAERIQDRTEPRAPFSGCVGVAVREHGWFRIGWLRFRDLSGSGVAADCSVPLAEGDELIGRLRLPTFPAPLGFRARVVRVAAPKEDNDPLYVCSFGAKLVDPSPTLQRLLRRYVAASEPPLSST